MNKTETLTTKIGATTRTVKVTYTAVEADYLSMTVANEADALLAAFCYRWSVGTKIEAGADGTFGVVVYKKDPR